MDEFEEDEIEKSKSQLKREMTALQDLGLALTKLSPEKLAIIPMGDSLREAIEEAPKIKKHGSIRRHMQFVGKLMRKEDNEAIVEAYKQIQESERNQARKFHTLENWRDELISGGKEKLAAFLKHYPQTDRQQLNQLIRNCQKEMSQEKLKGATRKLFQFIRDTTV